MLVRATKKATDGLATANRPAADDELQKSEAMFSATPGGLLQQARIARGLTEEEVADRLHLSQRWIKDIEADEFCNAPALIYIRGYLRAYARLVDLSPLEVLSAFEAMGWQESQTDDSQEWLRSMGQQSQRERLSHLYRRIGIGFAVVAAIAVVILFVLWWHMDERGLPPKWGLGQGKTVKALQASAHKKRQQQVTAGAGVTAGSV